MELIVKVIMSKKYCIEYKPKFQVRVLSGIKKWQNYIYLASFFFELLTDQTNEISQRLRLLDNLQNSFSTIQ